MALVLNMEMLPYLITFTLPVELSWDVICFYLGAGFDAYLLLQSGNSVILSNKHSNDLDCFISHTLIDCHEQWCPTAAYGKNIGMEIGKKLFTMPRQSAHHCLLGHSYGIYVKCPFRSVSLVKNIHPCLPNPLGGDLRIFRTSSLAFAKNICEEYHLM